MRRAPRGAAAAALLALTGVSQAQQGAAPAPPAAPPTTSSTAAAAAVTGWNEFIEGLRVLPEHMLARLPPSMQNDPQVQQEVGRLALESLAASTLDAIGGDGDYPAFLPQIGRTLNIGQPNADTVYRLARVTPGGTYRLRGQRGSLRMAIIGQVGPMPGEPGATAAQPGPTRAYHDLNALQVDRNGRFDVLLSASRPAGYSGDWWQLLPTTTKLLLRQVSADWSREGDPTISIERVDQPLRRPRRSAADLEQRLRQLPTATGFMAQLFITHVDQLRREGYVNRLKQFDTSQIGGLAGQFYYEGAYQLGDNEALIVETKVPAGCRYSSMILTNELYETTDWYDSHSSLNDTQYATDADGVLRIVVAARDPGVLNWLDTTGYSSGVIQGRWMNCESQPIPTVRKVAAAELRAALPAGTRTITPAERERLVRERRYALAQRPLW